MTTLPDPLGPALLVLALVLAAIVVLDPKGWRDG